jgi:hypothetical protein
MDFPGVFQGYIFFSRTLTSCRFQSAVVKRSLGNVALRTAVGAAKLSAFTPGLFQRSVEGVG